MWMERQMMSPINAWLYGLILPPNIVKSTIILAYCMFFNYIYAYGVSSVSYDAMWSNMCLMQPIVEFWRQSQSFSEQMEAITWNGQMRVRIGGNPPHSLLPISYSPSFSSKYKQANQCTKRQSSKWRIIDDYLEFWEPTLPDFKEVVGSSSCISIEA